MMGLKFFRRSLRRRRLKRATAEALKRGDCRIVVGAAHLVPEHWLGTEAEELDISNSADWARYFVPNSIDAILAEHVWEHLERESGLIAAKLCHQYLRPGGYLRAAVPDGYHPNQDYIEHVRPGGRGSDAHQHKMLYNEANLCGLFRDAGFEQLDLLEHFDRAGQFHATTWDEKAGMIRRSLRFDSRNENGQPIMTSLIVDARKAA